MKMWQTFILNPPKSRIPKNKPLEEIRMTKISFIGIALIGLMIAGCGPSAEQKQMLTDLTAEVTTMVSDASSSLTKMDDIAGKLTSAISDADSIAKKYPKEAAVVNSAMEELNMAKSRVTGVKDNVSAWVKNYKTRDLTKMKFEEIIANLKTSKDELSTATSEIQGALGAAGTALENYNTIASGLVAKVAKR